MSNRLWEMYRGTHVSTGVLESMHMALEKWLLEYAKTASKEELEAMCIYLLKNSKSASISAVVTSVVLANPEKLFNVAVILFKTKEFFLYDTGRLLKDRSRKSDLLMLRNSYPSNDYENEFHENERIEACDDSHRTHSLENQALFYQWFQVDNIDKDEVKRRQDTIWAIWDNYYSQLPPKAKESNSDKTWRLYLSRMDSRKMKLTTEKKNGQTLIGFSPKIDPKLKAFSNAALKESQDAMKHSNLMIWATAKWRGDENLTYIIPRFNDIIIGGTAQSNDWNLKVDPDDTADILRKAGVIANEFTDVKVLEEKVGLRPARDEIRLEAEDKNGKTLIHNYGHGGAGFTLSWGCAYNVVKLVKEQK
jgi:hypothetical protein